MKRALVCVILFLVSCGNNMRDADNVLTVSIPPLKYIVESIVGDDFRIEVILPAGASAETYEPTPVQMVDVHNSKMVFNTGLIDFEQKILSDLTSADDGGKYINLSAGIDLIGGHSHHHAAHVHTGADPHIWTSPKALKIMALNAFDAIRARYPDSVAYKSGYDALVRRLDVLDSVAGARITASGIKSFVVFHPSFTYYASDYSIEQIALEHDGKQPSAERMRELVERLKPQGIRYVLYQKEFPRDVAEVFASEIGAQTAEVNILDEDIVSGILNVTDLITER